MRTPTEVRIGDFQPEDKGFTFDPTAEGAVGEALVMRRAINELTDHTDIIPPAAIIDALLTTEEAIDASLTAHKSDGPMTQAAKRHADSPRDPNATGVHSFGQEDSRYGDTRILLPKAVREQVRFGEDSPKESLWRPTDPQKVEDAKEPVEFDPAAATVAKVALERVAEQNLANIDDPEKAAEVKEARDVLKDLFHEEVAVLPPEKPKEPDLPFVIPAEERRRRQSLGKLASLSLLFLLGGRR